MKKQNNSFFAPFSVFFPPFRSQTSPLGVRSRFRSYRLVTGSIPPYRTALLRKVKAASLPAQLVQELLFLLYTPHDELFNNNWFWRRIGLLDSKLLLIAPVGILPPDNLATLPARHLSHVIPPREQILTMLGGILGGFRLGSGTTSHLLLVDCIMEQMHGHLYLYGTYHEGVKSYSLLMNPK